MNILGGSPLGLINVYSTANANGDSTFNGGGSRKINVNNYNRAFSDTYPLKDIGNYSVIQQDINVNSGTRSLFNQSVITPYANMGGDNLKKQGLNRKLLHNNNIYDTSLLNIIETLSKTMGALRPSEFAYLKDVGVYPNNRLMIARRFAAPIGDNIFNKPNSKNGAIATLISWKPQDEDFLEISFGEKWEDAKADFTEVLNSLGKDFTMGGGLSLGNMSASAVGGIPLPGFTEVLQRAVLKRLGILDPQGLEDPLPSGNPNLIKEAKRRKTITFSEAGSGLKCSVSLKMVCVWEQKFISGIDPTIVFQDILSMITRFGTSNSDSYGFSDAAVKKVSQWINHPETVVSDLIEAITYGLKFVQREINNAINGFSTDTNKGNATSEDVSESKRELSTLTSGKAYFDNFAKQALSMLATQIQKYKVEIEGIARALSGAPSTPWHVTIGNPMRPVFCAGDMYMDSDIKMTLGPTLAFNDLPSSITAEFTLVNARPWGMQEILAKFNSGSIRVSKGIKDINALGPKTVGTDTNIPDGPTASKTTSTNTNSSGSSSPTLFAAEKPKFDLTTGEYEPIILPEYDFSEDNKGSLPASYFPVTTDFKPIAPVSVTNVKAPFSTKFGVQGNEAINSDPHSIFSTQILKK